MTNRITKVFAERNGRKILVPFLTVGYPSISYAEELAHAVISTGADMLELGIPFSDPLADGPQVQLSSQIALQNSVNLETVFDTARRIRKLSDIPLIAMGYFNPVYAYGVPNFLTAAKEAGIDGLIIPDLPPEEAQDYIELARDSEISTIFLVAPTSTRGRISVIQKSCSDFVYAVTVTGVTGAGKSFDDQTDTYLARLRKQLSKPFLAGFGVSSPESATRLCRHADGVVIGSALIREIEANNRSEQAIVAVQQLLASIRQSLK